MQRTVDRGLVKMIAWKRTVTGSASIVGSFIMLAIARMRGEHPASMALLGAAILLGVGIWALRDGIRLLKMLRAG